MKPRQFGAPAPRFWDSARKQFARNWRLYLLLTLPIAFVIIFKYAAYPGLRMAFMNYKPAKGYAGSEWVGLDIFEKILGDRDFHRALKNSLIFNFLDLLVGFPIPVILAIMLNELRFNRFKRVSQTILYLPHFLSWVIIASVALNLFKPETGLINIMLKNMGVIHQGIPFLSEKWNWAVTYLLIGVWQNMGWGSILYLAAITGIDTQLYEAATIDGANRMRRVWHVTLPGIRPTMVTLLIMNLGRLMGSNFERLDALGNVQVKEFQYQLAIYIATTVGLFQSVVGVLLVLAADRAAKKLGEDGLL
jgi:putative aldouronate transport system permease protein